GRIFLRERQPLARLRRWLAQPSRLLPDVPGEPSQRPDFLPRARTLCLLPQPRKRGENCWRRTQLLARLAAASSGYPVSAPVFDSDLLGRSGRLPTILPRPGTRISAVDCRFAQARP